MRRLGVVLLSITVLLAASLACSGVGGSSSLTSSRSSAGDSGRIEIKGSADGTSTGEIEIAQNFPGAWVDLEIAAGVESGQYTIEFLNDAGASVLSLDVESGEPVRESVPVMLDDGGAVPYTLTASDAEGIQLVISFTIR
jgi:hypothetical protein